MTIDVIVTHKTMGSDRVAVATINGQQKIIEPGEHFRCTLHDGNDLQVVERLASEVAAPAPEVPQTGEQNTQSSVSSASGEPGTVSTSSVHEADPAATTPNPNVPTPLDMDPEEAKALGEKWDLIVKHFDARGYGPNGTRDSDGATVFQLLDENGTVIETGTFLDLYTAALGTAEAETAQADEGEQAKTE